MWVLKPRILSRSCWSKPLMTLMTMISTATPSVTPSTEIKVMTETKVLLGRRYRSASSSSNGNRDMQAKLDAAPPYVNESRSAMRPSPLTSPALRLHSRTAVSSLSFNRFRVVSLPCHALVVLTLVSFAASCFGAEPASPAPIPGRADETNTQDTLRAYLQLQEQLHATQLAIERNRSEAGLPRRRMPKPSPTGCQGIEQALALQRAQELDAMQSSNRAMLFVAGLFAALGFLAMMFMAYFQWRTINRLAEIIRGVAGRPCAGLGFAGCRAGRGRCARGKRRPGGAIQPAAARRAGAARKAHLRTGAHGPSAAA